ncbi:AsmA-like C-terminal region-containing protein [Winogradskyella immobilis]|uniref:AsmA-like C-terminal region-containing protein n=1 Tax=Winogradskyella immobilis TaxID=2816852 RepID=A0ABS8EM00_9FLAO|nr:AsmA-like C-terminal region-containing protein [Winogradskyella immobilis]MCC1484056.1 AsmA-like C-terminal region-containing protein [Winogradskyella immobilis]MCG0016148.1 AsmA-like C-terminal region-containing protein [Winogradskyella immobilis]
MKIKRFWKRILIALILVPALIVVGLMLYIQSNQSEIIKGEIAKLNQEHKGRISVSKSDLSLFGNFPHISIKVDDVKIFETKADNAPVIMDVKDIYVGFNLWDIVSGDYDIQSLLVEEGVFNIVIHENNTTNIQNSLASSSETESDPTNLSLNKIKFKNLDIHTLDEATNTDVEKFVYTGIGGFSKKDGVIAGHIDTDFELNVIKDGDTTFINKKHFEIHTDLVFNEKSGILDIQPSGITMENGDFELEGSIDTKNDVDLNLLIKGIKHNFDTFIAFAPVDLIPLLERYNNAGDIYFNASIQGAANKGNRPAINATFGAGKAFLENTARAKKIDNMGFNGHFTNGTNRDASTMEFSLTNMKASLEEGEFKGSIIVKNFESPEVDMQVNSNFNLDFVAEFFELEQVQNVSGEVSLKMNFHDIIDIDNPQKALQKLNQAYYAELKVDDLSLAAKQLPVPLDTLNVNLIMNGKEATLNQFELSMGNSDIFVSGFLSDLPSIVHHTNIPVEAHLDITSNYIDLSELTHFSKQDTIQTGIDEQIKDLSLGLSFKTSAKDFTESEYLPKGEFFIDSLYANLEHYPHQLHDFHADILIDNVDLKIENFAGYIDDSDFHFNGLIHDYSFWMQPELNGDVDLDINLRSKKLQLENVFSYQGENYVPEEYRHESFDDLALHFSSSMHYKDSALHSIDLALDKLDTKMKLHPQRFHDFRGNIHYEDQHIVIKDFHGEIGTTNFNFDLNYYLGDDLQIKKRDNYLALKANYIDFDALFNFNLNPPELTKNVSSTTADIKAHAEAFNIYELPFTDMQFKADISHFIYHRIDLKKIKADLRTTPDHYIYIDTLTMDAAGGNIKLGGYFNGSDPKHIYMQPDLIMNNVDLDKLLFKFENFGQDHLVSENLQGKLTSKIKGKIRVYPDMVPDLDQSTLEMDVKVLNGRLKNYNPMLALSDYMGDKNLQNIRFDTLQNSLGIENGEINIPTMTIESTLGHIELSGTHDSDQNIDYYIRIPWKTVRKASWQKLFGNKKDTIVNPEQVDAIVEVDPNRKIRYLNLKVKGIIDDYKVSLGKKKGK